MKKSPRGSITLGSLYFKKISKNGGFWQWIFFGDPQEPFF